MFVPPRQPAAAPPLPDVRARSLGLAAPYLRRARLVAALFRVTPLLVTLAAGGLGAAAAVGAAGRRDLVHAAAPWVPLSLLVGVALALAAAELFRALAKRGRRGALLAAAERRGKLDNAISSALLLTAPDARPVGEEWLLCALSRAEQAARRPAAAPSRLFPLPWRALTAAAAMWLAGIVLALALYLLTDGAGAEGAPSNPRPTDGDVEWPVAARAAPPGAEKGATSVEGNATESEAPGGATDQPSPRPGGEGDDGPPPKREEPERIDVAPRVDEGGAFERRPVAGYQETPAPGEPPARPPFDSRPGFQRAMHDPRLTAAERRLIDAYHRLAGGG
ncbi:MAG: hypothetical protein HY719_00740 [Planctomycetes bacterium]|nr:hypothetical protein [Planctomycetota bacterium]